MVKFYEELPVKLLKFQFWKKISSNVLVRYKFTLDTKPGKSSYLFNEHDVWGRERWRDFLSWCNQRIQFIEQTIIFA